MVSSNLEGALHLFRSVHRNRVFHRWRHPQPATGSGWPFQSGLLAGKLAQKKFRLKTVVLQGSSSLDHSAAQKNSYKSHLWTGRDKKLWSSSKAFRRAGNQGQKHETNHDSTARRKERNSHGERIEALPAVR
jgi:hypothetical protein